MPLDTPSHPMQRVAITDAGAHILPPNSCASIPPVPWHVAYTKPQAEVAIEAKLRDEGAGVWLPREIRNNRLCPLIPRYIFLQLTGERLRWGCVIRTAGGEELGAVLRSPAGMPKIIPPSALETLQSQCDDDGVLLRRDLLSPVLPGWRRLCDMTPADRQQLVLRMFGRAAMEAA